MFHHMQTVAQQPSSYVDPALTTRLHEMTAIAEHSLRVRHNWNKQQIAKWWMGMGNSAQKSAEIAMLRSMVNTTDSTGPIRTACEVGMNAGHSATALLEGLETVLVTFDLMILPYSNATRAALQERYPGRIHFFGGRSQVQVPHYAAVARQQLGLPLCDVWFIDGDHENGALFDMLAALNVSRDGAMMVADDCSPKHPKVQSAWRTLVDGGLIYDSWNRTMSHGMKGWCVGRYKRSEHNDAWLANGLSKKMPRAHSLRLDPVSSKYWQAHAKGTWNP